MRASSPARHCRSTAASTCIEAVPDYAPPQKRSVLIAGHQTSISLEPIFWRALEAAARERGVPINALVAEIDVARLEFGAAAEPDVGDPPVAIRDRPSRLTRTAWAKRGPASGASAMNRAGSISSSSMTCSPPSSSDDDVDARVGRRRGRRGKRGLGELDRTRRRVAAADDPAIFRLYAELAGTRHLATEWLNSPSKKISEIRRCLTISLSHGWTSIAPAADLVGKRVAAGRSGRCRKRSPRRAA